MSRFHITIASDLTELFVVSIVVRGICDHLGVDAAEASGVELCAVEAVANTIKHAYRGESGHEVWLDVSFTRERLDLDVRDRGVSMPEEQVRKLSVGSHVFEFDPADLDAVPEGGMGLTIIHQVMDEASYWTDSGTNCLRLTKLLLPVKSEELRA